MILALLCAVVQGAWAQTSGFQKLDKWTEKWKPGQQTYFGYPVNQQSKLHEFYEWYLSTGMEVVNLNNAGDPMTDEPWSMSSQAFEREVIEYFAPLYGFEQNDVWGIVTHSGTDGNNHAIKVQQPTVIPIAGTVIKDKDERTITVKQGWNAIGYTPAINLTVETALSDYYDSAQPGDVIKSHTEFAYFTKSGNTGRWRGNLQYMKPGEGYMMLRKGAGNASFTYPYYEPGSAFREDWSTSSQRSAAAKARSTMSVSAVIEGFETEDGDRLVAYAGGEECGSTMINGESSKVNYLSIAGNGQQPIWFVIERDGEIVASTSETMTFNANAVIGSPDEPTAISFVHTDYASGKWYSIGGLLLQKKPTLKGFYIFNGKKVIVK